jgi:uncharacterized protein (TIGR03546 family)
LVILNSETEPGQISLGFCFGMIAGFTPLWSLHNLLVLFLILVLRVNLSAFLLGLALFSFLAFALDPLFHATGLAILTQPSLEPLFTALYNSPLWRIERFNDSIVMGSLVVSLLAFAPLLLLGNALIRRYRVHVLAWLQRTRLVSAIKASRFYGVYERVAKLGDLT